MISSHFLWVSIHLGGLPWTQADTVTDEVYAELCLFAESEVAIYGRAFKVLKLYFI